MRLAPKKMKFVEQTWRGHYIFAVLVEATLRFWNIFGKKYSGPTIYLGESSGAVVVSEESSRAYHFLQFGGTFWLQELSRSSLCESTTEDPQQAVMSAQESGPSLGLSLDLGKMLIAPKPSPLSTCHCIVLREPTTTAITSHSASGQRLR